VNWTGAGGDFNWDNPANWDSGQVPGVGDDAVINLGDNSFTVYHSSGVADSVHSLTDDASLSITGGSLSLGSTSSILGALTLGNGTTLSGSGDLTIGGSLSWYNHATLAMGGTTTAQGVIFIDNAGDSDHTLDGGTLRNQGTADVTGHLTVSDGATIDNRSAATWDFQNNAYVRQGPGATSTFQNEGLVEADATTSDAGITLPITNTGTMTSNGGNLGLGTSYATSTTTTGFTAGPGSGYTFAGNWTIPAAVSAQNVAFVNGTYTVASVSVPGQVYLGGSTVEDQGAYSAGSTYLNGGTHLTLNGPSISLGDLSENNNGSLVFGASTQASATAAAASLMNNSSIAGNANLTINDLFTWSSSTVNITGTLTLLGGALVSNGATLAGGTLVAPSPVTSGDGSGITVTGGGTVDGTPPPQGPPPPPVPVDLAGGTLAGSGTLNADLTNNGLVNPGGPGSTATIDLLGNYTQTSSGVFQVDAGSTYDVLGVHGTVSLGGTLQVAPLTASPPQTGQTFVILNNEGSSPISGTFSGLPEGASFSTPGGYIFQITYQGGDGNDVAITETNTPPSNLVLNPSSTSMAEGSTLTLGGSFVDPDSGQTHSVAINWGDGSMPTTVNLSAGVLSFSGATHVYQDNPVGQPTGSFTVSAVVTDQPGSSSPPATASIQVSNVAPTASLSGPTDGYNGVTEQLRTFTLGATDPSPVDQAAGFTYSINWGDGNTSTLSGLSGITASHAYATAGTFNVQMTATDKDGGVSSTATEAVNIRASEQQGSTFAIGGVASNDSFVITATATSGTFTWKLNNGATTTTTSSQVAVYGGPASNLVTVNGTSAADAFTIASTTVNVAGVTVSGSGIQAWSVLGLGGNDTVTVSSTGLPVSIDGGSGTNTMIGPNQTNTWAVTGTNTGTLDGAGFANMQNLTGGTGNDTFAFQGSGRITGSVSGGGGSDTIDVSAYTASAATVNLQATTATPISGTWSNVTSFIANGTTSTLVGTNTATTWTISSTGAGTAGSTSFSGFANLTGGTANDTFAFQGSGSVSGSVNGGTGTNSIDVSAYTAAAATVNLQAKTATPIGGTWSNVTSFVGNGTTSTLVGPNTATTWTISSTNAGTAGTTPFSGFANLTGGTGNDKFTLSSGATISGTIDGGTGTNTIDFSTYSTSGVVVDLPLGTATATGGIAHIQNVNGSAVGGDILVGDANPNVLRVYAGHNILIGGAGADTLYAGSNSGGDILIGGSTSYDSNVGALQTILATWSTSTPSNYSSVIATIMSTSFADPLNASTVFDDAAVDVLNGVKGTVNDWFFAHTTGTNIDTVNNKDSGETVTSI
jgi:hypothetical protein